MKHYELFYIVPGALPENNLETLQNEVKGLVAAAGASVTRQESWGRKKLTYPIQKERNGYYQLLELDGEAEAVLSLQSKLKLHKGLLRFLLVEHELPSEKDLLAQEEARRRAQLRKTKVMAERTASERAAEEKVHAKAETKISLEELDKKLDELLDQDIAR